MTPADAITKAYEATAACLKSCGVDCRFSGSTAILCVLRHTSQGRQVPHDAVIRIQSKVSVAARLSGGPASKGPRLRGGHLGLAHRRLPLSSPSDDALR